MKKKTTFLFLIAVHVAMLTLPIIAIGKGLALFEPKAIVCVLVLLLLSVLETALSSEERHSAHPTSIASGLALFAIGLLSITSSIDELGAWMGAPIAFSGILLRGFAINNLGSHFSSAIEPTSARLMSNGIYRAVRHPSELGLFLISIGLAVLGGSRSAEYVIAIVLIPSIVVRVILEERALYARFGLTHR